MSEAFIENLKMTLLIIGKAGSKESDCPITWNLYSGMIEWLFRDPAKVISQYKKNAGSLAGKLKEEGKTVEGAIKNKDRSIFTHIDLFPADVSKQYGSYINWYSIFLQKRLEDKIVDKLMSFVAKMND
jgi:hypothetical protein